MPDIANFLDRYQDKLALGLGWFSIGLGVAELLAPKGMARAVGRNGKATGVIRLFGAREIVTGIGLLTQRRPSPWLWARVAGDALDLTALGTGFTGRARTGRLTAATAAVAGVAALDVLCSRQFSRRPERRTMPIRVRKSLAINRPPEEVYQFWRDFERLPQFMNHLVSVRQTGENRSHWVAKGFAGMKLEWDSELMEDRPDELIRWRSLPGASVDNTGEVRFEPAPGGRGTILRVDFTYFPPAGKLGSTLAKLFGQSPQKQLGMDLLRFKQMIETGEIARTEGQSAARSRSTSRKFDDFVRA